MGAKTDKPKVEKVKEVKPRAPKNKPDQPTELVNEFSKEGISKKYESLNKIADSLLTKINSIEEINTKDEFEKVLEIIQECKRISDLSMSIQKNISSPLMDLVFYNDTEASKIVDFGTKNVGILSHLLDVYQEKKAEKEEHENKVEADINDKKERLEVRIRTYTYNQLLDYEKAIQSWEPDVDFYGTLIGDAKRFKTFALGRIGKRAMEMLNNKKPDTFIQEINQDAEDLHDQLSEEEKERKETVTSVIKNLIKSHINSGDLDSMVSRIIEYHGGYKLVLRHTNSINDNIRKGIYN